MKDSKYSAHLCIGQYPFYQTMGIKAPRTQILNYGAMGF
jgi:hypothetical protein